MQWYALYGVQSLHSCSDSELMGVLGTPTPMEKLINLGRAWSGDSSMLAILGGSATMGEKEVDTDDDMIPRKMFETYKTETAALVAALREDAALQRRDNTALSEKNASP